MIKFHNGNRLHVFTDGSVSSKLKRGYGAYLVVADLNESMVSRNGTVKLKRFDQTSSTKLELQTVLWALGEIVLTGRVNLAISVYTDCQTIIGLTERRARLEETEYFSKNQKRLNNFELYQEFYQLTSDLNCEFIKVAGHQQSHKKDEIDKLFGLVDRASRRALREEI